MPAAQREDRVVDDVVVGARRVRSAVEQAVRPDGPVRLLVAGPRGSAKSSVLSSLADEARRRGCTVETLLPGMDPVAVPADTVLIADDLHALDAATLAALERRADDPGSSLVAATRPWAQTAGVSRICEALESTRPALVLGRVARGDVLDHRPDLAPACAEWILEATSGVTWLVSAALRAHDDRDCVGDPAHGELARSLEETVAHRLAGAREDVRLAVEHATGDDPHAVSAEVVHRAHAEGLLLRDGHAAPIMRSTMASGLAPRGLAERAAASFAAGELDAAAFLAETALARAGSTGRGALVSIAASTWAARGMLEIGARLYEVVPVDERGAGATIARFGAGVDDLTADAVAATTGLPSTLRIAADLLRDGLAATLDIARSDGAIATIARASQLSTASRSTDPLPELPAVIAAAVAQSQGDLAGARSAIDAALAGRQGGGVAQPRLLLWRAWLSLHLVRARDAREALAAALAAGIELSPRDEFVAHAVRLGLARRYGDATTLAAAWETARPALAAIDVDLYLLQPLTEFIASGAKLKDVETTDAATLRALQLLHGLGSPALWSAPLHWAAIQRGILLNTPDSLAPHAHALAAAAGHSLVAATMAGAGRIWTMVLAHTADPDEVEASALALARIGLTWDAARLAGSAAAASDDRRIAARLLSRAREIHPLDAPRPTTASADATRAESTASSALSRREIDVARLIVEGKTYAEIGSAIFISPRTAEHHVASIRRRLGATSRSDLIAKLRSALASEDADQTTTSHTPTGDRS